MSFCRVLVRVLFPTSGYPHNLINERRRRFHGLSVLKSNDNRVSRFNCVITNRQTCAFVCVVNHLPIAARASSKRVNFRRPQLSVHCTCQNVRRISTRSIKGNLSNDLTNAMRATSQVDMVSNGKPRVSGIAATSLRRAKGRRTNRNGRNFRIDISSGIPFVRIAFVFLIRPGSRSNVIRRCICHLPFLQGKFRNNANDLPITSVREGRVRVNSVFLRRFFLCDVRFLRVATVRCGPMAIRNGFAHTTFPCSQKNSNSRCGLLFRRIVGFWCRCYRRECCLLFWLREGGRF